MATYLFDDPATGLKTTATPITTSAGAGDAAKIIQTGSNGRIDESLMPPGIGADTAIIQASEALTAGDFVNIHNVGGARVRLANASTAGAANQAHGFVRANVTSGANATVYFEGPNDQLTGLTVGTTYALSATTPGKVVALASASTTTGHSLQVLGVAVGATVVNVEIGEPTIR